jgi:hypothetical protein
VHCILLISIFHRPFALSLIRLFLLLTKPLSKPTNDALTSVIKKAKGKESVEESRRRVKKELDARKNAYSQLGAHLAFKEALAQGGLPFQTFPSKHSSQFAENVFVVLLKYLEEPLSKPSHQRSDEDKVLIESILTLIE